MEVGSNSRSSIRLPATNRWMSAPRPKRHRLRRPRRCGVETNEPVSGDNLQFSTQFPRRTRTSRDSIPPPPAPTPSAPTSSCRPTTTMPLPPRRRRPRSSAAPTSRGRTSTARFVSICLAPPRRVLHRQFNPIEDRRHPAASKSHPRPRRPHHAGQ